MNQTKNFSGLVSLMMAVLIGALPFAAPEACAQALREGLTLCSGPLLLSLYPFLVVSALLIQCPLGDVLALPFRPVAWLVGVYAPCAARVLLVGFLGGFAPAANASAEAVRSGQMTPEEADRLLPACVCSGPSFVILTVGQTLLGSTEVGVLLFLAQITANYLCAALLSRLSRTNRNEKRRSPRPKQQEMPQLRLDGILAQSTLTYLKLRLCALLPDAGCRSGSAASTCREHGLRDASGSLFRVRSCFPHGLLGQHPLLCGIECTGAFCPDAGADDLPARNDPPAAVYRPGAASAAVAGHFHPAFAGTGGRSVQHAACPGHPDAAASAGLRCAASCGVQLCSLPADQSASAAGFSRNFPRKS